MNSSLRGNGEKKEVRGMLAMRVSTYSIVLVGIVATVALLASPRGIKTAEIAMQLFNSILPLVGAWVGTVLAFYFTRDSFQAATEAAIETYASVAEKKLKPITATEAMRKLEGITKITADDFSLLKVKDIQHQMESAGVKRIPILDSQGKFVAIVHLQPISTYLLQVATDATQNVDEVTIGDMAMTENATVQMFKNSAVFISTDRSLYDAKIKMEDLEKCQDVFVTSSGDRKGSVVGWITNNRILKEIRE
ncbi:hypothetical protein LRP49_18540 [Enterovibrio sp. ZSDZ35]|uniref:CBS domain-containing protein n=1 Tax=Enterovibrio qingdaonensis TaxID=2899818 RepID=A0ABT5QQM3_9GAMM|nr:hypothetical protein [Enterovibrio sp. ZSDZ35]MDD1783169.1 hypothetical protein [Enterovibrio sp. ZSDZ35]